MTNYKKLYFTLFNRVTDVIEALEKLTPIEKSLYVSLLKAKEDLKCAQIDVEEMFISDEENNEPEEE